jgi:asparagine synthetase B (glutamine-hydrolysing)
MCGIFGFVTTKNSFNSERVKSITDQLLLLSESRGKDSSGVAIVREKEIIVYKEPLSAHKFIKQKKYLNLFSTEQEKHALIGHARMETNGSFSLSNNNQPVVKDGIVTIHNGIIVNDSDIWKKHTDIKRDFQVDTELYNSLLRKYIQKKESLLEALRATLSELQGSYAFATLFNDFNSLVLVTNTGSLYTITDSEKSFVAFVSEKHFAEELVSKQFPSQKEIEIKQVKADSGLIINLQNLNILSFQVSGNEKTNLTKKTAKSKTINQIGSIITEVPQPISLRKNNQNFKTIEKLINEEYTKDRDKISKLRRCTKCILPETMPFIEFDEEGVCSFCHSYEKREIKGVEELEKEVAKYRKGNGEPDCIVSFSGGRDSCYSMHYAVKELGLNPLAYSYDWGMITDLGRRNQARMTGQLGVEHILISADIQKKREYIRKNVSAWLNKPEIGMIPLFMAGDKQYFSHLNKLRKETGLELVIYAGNSLENTYFKHGFANVKLETKDKKAYQIGGLNSLKLMWYYFKNYIKNPAYLNSSIIDTISAFVSSYGIPKNYLYLYKYIPWREKEVEDVLLKEYDWELSPDTKSSWRIGDGTASFYNYIYYVMTGLTENDTFRSNQIREGLISRSNAEKLALEENKPRIESILWYCNTINLDAESAIKKINSAKKIY